MSVSFKENRTAVDIVNRALSKIGQTLLSGELATAGGEPGRQARLHYKSVVRMLLSKHHWNNATRRAALVAGTNNRSAEWLFAYAAPADMAFPVSMSDTQLDGTAPVAYYRGLGALYATLYGKPMFMYSEGAIYSQLTDGVLEYVSYDITENDFSEEMEQMVIAFLAARFAYGIAKNAKLGAALEEEAINKLDSAIASNLNEQKHTYGNHYLSDGELARNGVDPHLAGFLGRY